MLSVDHLNIDGPPIPLKCVRKFGSDLVGEVMYRCVRVLFRKYALFDQGAKKENQVHRGFEKRLLAIVRLFVVNF